MHCWFCEEANSINTEGYLTINQESNAEWQTWQKGKGKGAFLQEQ